MKRVSNKVRVSARRLLKFIIQILVILILYFSIIVYCLCDSNSISNNMNDNTQIKTRDNICTTNITSIKTPPTTTVTTTTIKKDKLTTTPIDTAIFKMTTANNSIDATTNNNKHTNSTTFVVTTHNVRTTTTTIITTTLSATTPIEITEEVIETDNNTDTTTSLEYIMLCNCVAYEYGADWVDEYEKAKVVEVIMNRVNSPDFPNTVYEVLIQSGQFSGVDNYIYLNSYSDKVTDSVINAVDLYFSNPSAFNHGYLYFEGDGNTNYFH